MSVYLDTKAAAADMKAAAAQSADNKPIAKKPRDCAPGVVYNDGLYLWKFKSGAAMAHECAEQLTNKTGKKFEVKTEYKSESVESGMRLRQTTHTYHRVVEDWLPNFMCEYVYGNKAEAVERCKKHVNTVLYQSGKDKPAAEKSVLKEEKGFWSSIGSFLKKLAISYGETAKKSHWAGKW